jgi:RimJ/RimL family protein N-acetyltransferase
VNEHSPAAAFPDHITITGLGLTLREWTDADIPAMAELFDDPDVDRFTPLRAPFDLAAARAYLQTARQTRAEGGRLQLAITTDGHTPQGEILLFRARGSDLTPDTADTAELAYAIGPRHRHQRLATRAVRLITDYAYTTLGFTAVVLHIAAANTASIAVAHATGFRLTPEPPLTLDTARDPLMTWQHARHHTEA